LNQPYIMALFLRLAGAALAFLACVAVGVSTPAQGLNLADYGVKLSERADQNLTGYLGAFFLGADPYVYFYLSNGNNPTSFKSLNKGAPIMRPTKGTGGVRDPYVIQGGGTEAGKKWYIIGTDLHIGKVGNS
jgi:hypothetical protein